MACMAPRRARTRTTRPRRLNQRSSSGRISISCFNARLHGPGKLVSPVGREQREVGSNCQGSEPPAQRRRLGTRDPGTVACHEHGRIRRPSPAIEHRLDGELIPIPLNRKPERARRLHVWHDAEMHQQQIGLERLTACAAGDPYRRKAVRCRPPPVP